MKHIKLATIALASAVLSSTFALAAAAHHQRSIRTYELHTRRSGVPSPTYGFPDSPSSVSAGGYLWNGRSASEWGGG